MMPKMRLLNEAYEEIKKIDPDTAVTKWHIRELAINGKIKTVMAGNKRLINMDSLFDYLNEGETQEAVHEEYGIRRII